MTNVAVPLCIALSLITRLNAAGPQDLALPVANASFEAPYVDPNAFPALPLVDGWIETDRDTEGSANTGVFSNVPPAGAGLTHYLDNADGRQVAFLGTEAGNGFAQNLAVPYRPGFTYRLDVAVAVSAMFPPSLAEPADTLELAFYYLDANSPVDIAVVAFDANGLSAGTLHDRELELGPIDVNDPWAGKPLGIALRAAGLPGGFWDLDHVRVTESLPYALPVVNASFEAPFVDPNAFPALPLVDGWLESDRDTLGSQNTGVFANTPAEQPNHIANADGRQLAFVGSETGNGLSQLVATPFRVGSVYRLTAGLAVSALFPPALGETPDRLDLVLYYEDANGPVDLALTQVDANGLSATQLRDARVYLGVVEPNDPWAGRPVGISLRAEGAPGGFWDLDHVRLDALLPDPNQVPADPNAPVPD